MKLAFKRGEFSDEFSGRTVSVVNDVMARLLARKVESVPIGLRKGGGFPVYATRTYIQSYMRRSLSFIEAGFAEHKAGRHIVTALIARALMENAAVVWDLVVKINSYLEVRDYEGWGEYVFRKAMATRLPEEIERYGIEVSAVNILTYVDRMNELWPHFRKCYDEMSEVVHPNAFGGVVFFSKRDAKRRRTVFDDGHRFADSTWYWFFLSCWMVSVAEVYAEGLEHQLKAVPPYSVDVKSPTPRVLSNAPAPSARRGRN